MNSLQIRDPTIFPKRGCRETAQDHAAGLLSGRVRPDSPTRSADEPAAKATADDAEKTMAKLAAIGGRHVDQHPDPKFVVENRFEWAFGKKVIRGVGFTDKGGPHETQIEAYPRHAIPRTTRSTTWIATGEPVCTRER